MDNYLYIDGEMVPTLDPLAKAEIIANNTPEPFDESTVKGLKDYNGNLKNPELIAEDKAKKDAQNAEIIAEAKAKWSKEVAGLGAVIEKQWRDLCFKPETGVICSLAAAWNDHKPLAFHSKDQTIWTFDDARKHETAILERFFALYQNVENHAGVPPVIVGHNVAEFDLPYINKRAIILGVRIPKSFPRHWDKNWDTVVDTQKMWTGKLPRAGDKDSFIGQDRLAKLLGHEGKGDVTGANVYDLFASGSHAAIGAYNSDDIVCLRRNHKRMLQLDRFVDRKSAETKRAEAVKNQDDIPH